jgi:hypothetical protein
MKRFALLTYGFEKPTPEIMAAWGAWFGSIKDHVVETMGFGAGREISREGTRDLPWDLQSLTGLVIVKAENLEAAEKIASGNPYITSIRVYEIRSQ